jgi:hypothetical protein
VLVWTEWKLRNYVIKGVRYIVVLCGVHRTVPLYCAECTAQCHYIVRSVPHSATILCGVYRTVPLYCAGCTAQCHYIVRCVPHNRLACRHDIDHFNKTSTWIITVVLTVVLAKHEIVPWWWFLHEPKHVGATDGILIVLIFVWFYNCVHHVGTIKRALK